MTRVVVHVDGGARGNPGPAAAAAVVSTPDGDVLDEAQQTLGVATNNVAEYRGLLLGLRRARELGATEVEVVNDSELVAKQIAGALQPEEQTAVLGDVVRRHTEGLVRLVDDLAVRRGEDGRRRGGPGVAAGAAVDVDDELQPSVVSSGGNSPGTRERRRSRRSRCSLGSVAPRARRSLLRRSMMTFTFGSSL